MPATSTTDIEIQLGNRGRKRGGLPTTECIAKLVGYHGHLARTYKFLNKYWIPAIFHSGLVRLHS